MTISSPTCMIPLPVWHDPAAAGDALYFPLAPEQRRSVEHRDHRERPAEPEQRDDRAGDQAEKRVDAERLHDRALGVLADDEGPLVLALPDHGDSGPGECLESNGMTVVVGPGRGHL